MALCKEIYKLTESFLQRDIYAISSQMRRAVVSIPSNIAEGRSRATKDDVSYQKILALNTEVAKMLHVMIYKLNGASRS